MLSRRQLCVARGRDRTTRLVWSFLMDHRDHEIHGKTIKAFLDRHRLNVGGYLAFMQAGRYVVFLASPDDPERVPDRLRLPVSMCAKLLEQEGQKARVG